jgi:hypothetical protein
VRTGARGRMAIGATPLSDASTGAPGPSSASPPQPSATEAMAAASSPPAPERGARLVCFIEDRNSHLMRAVSCARCTCASCHRNAARARLCA